MTDKLEMIAKSEIIVVLDRSGSMTGLKADMEGGFDTFIEEQKKEKSDACTVSLYQFDDKYNVVYENKALEEVPKLNLNPRGGTALLDAVGKTIGAVTDRYAELDEKERPSKVIFMIITDGEENSSREFNRDQIKTLIESSEKKKDWQFVYLGADAKAFDEATSMGVAVASNYTPSSAGVHRLFSANAMSARSYRSSPIGAKYSVARDLTDETADKLDVDPDPGLNQLLDETKSSDSKENTPDSK